MGVPSKETQFFKPAFTESCNSSDQKNKKRDNEKIG